MMTAVERVNRLWRTVRHLRPEQIYRRIWFRLARPKIDLSPPAALRKRLGAWSAPARRQPSMTAATNFCFLNRERNLNEVGWDSPMEAKLWRYNQHYFDDLNAQKSLGRRVWHVTLIERWIEENPPAAGSGWEPYPTSVRIVNWIKWSLSGGILSAEAEASLAVQVRWLACRLEWHILGNHLFINAKALIFAGLYFDGVEAEGWRETGLAILTKELDEQFLEDGGQFELSPMYHALALEDLLDLINVLGVYPECVATDFLDRLRAKAKAAIQWLRLMSHPDGKISFFNDAAFGVAPENDELYDYAERLGIHVAITINDINYLSSSGYVHFSKGLFTLIADFAQVGPDYLPGHAHADTLGFELSYRDQRIFVQSGTSEYGISPERDRQRGTAAHNCLLTARENSSEVWSGFRVGRRARPGNIRIDRVDDTITAEATHDGYLHLVDRPVPHRLFRLTDCEFIVEDSINTRLYSEARYHFHPEIKIEDIGKSGAKIVLPDGTIMILEIDAKGFFCESSTWHPEFGMSLRNKCLVLPLETGSARMKIGVLTS